MSLKESGHSKIYVIVPYLPLYRLGIYREMSSHGKIEFIFIASKKENQGIRNIEDATAINSNISWIKTKILSLNLKGRVLILWQTKVFRSLFDSSANIYVFSEGIQNVSNIIHMFIAKMIGKKVVLWGHGYYGNEKGLKSWLRLFLIAQADKFMLYGERSKRLLLEKGINKDKLYVIYNSLDYLEHMHFYHKTLQRYKSISERDSLKTNKKEILFIGRLTKGKRVDLLLKAMVLLEKKNFPTKLLIVGTGPEQVWLQGFVEKNALDVSFLGAIYDESKLSELMIRSELLVSPGNVGLNCIHALSYGLPVITHDNFAHQMPEYESIVNGVTGVFFRYNDEIDLAEKIMLWFSESCKDRDVIRVRCQEIIHKHYNPTSQMFVIEKTLKSLQ